MTDYESTYEEYQEQHKEDSFAFVKNIKPLHIGILLLAIFLGLTYYEQITQKSTLNLIVIVGIVAVGIYIFSRSKSKGNIDWDTGESILYKEISEDMKKVNSAFPQGILVMTKRGYVVPKPGYPVFFMYFYILESSTGIPHWFVGKIRKDNGEFIGCEQVDEETSGCPPYRHGSRGMGGGDSLEEDSIF